MQAKPFTVALESDLAWRDLLGFPILVLISVCPVERIIPTATRGLTIEGGRAALESSFTKMSSPISIDRGP
jgi:hypothetical protein